MQTCAVKRVDDFEITGDGKNSVWENAPWQDLLPAKGSGKYMTRVKVVYSARGIYCLFDCADECITSTGLKDGDNLWTEDVAEVFLWPDESQPLYFEYEISPLNAELVLLVPNRHGEFMGWSPWQYHDERKVRSATAVRGGAKQPGATVAGWSAEFFIPYALLKGLNNIPPKPGTRWRCNFYRIDYDRGDETWFVWSPGATRSFHETQHFGTLLFE